MVVLMIVLFGWQLVSEEPNSHAMNSDYAVFVLGGTQLANNHAAAIQLYDPVLQMETLRTILGDYHLTSPLLLPFVHPPYVALLAWPLHFFSPVSGFYLLGLTQLLLVLIAIWLLSRLLPNSDRYLLWLGSFAYLPLHYAFIDGQVSQMVFFSITLFWYGLRCDSP